jgi:hypothetical protein
VIRGSIWNNFKILSVNVNVHIELLNRDFLRGSLRHQVMQNHVQKLKNFEHCSWNLLHSCILHLKIFESWEEITSHWNLTILLSKWKRKLTFLDTLTLKFNSDKNEILFWKLLEFSFQTIFAWRRRYWKLVFLNSAKKMHLFKSLTNIFYQFKNFENIFLSIIFKNIVM